MTTSLQNSVFLKACRREPVPYTPVWLMRQAGRYMKDYRALREKVPFIELCKNKDLAAEITVTAQKTLGVDAAIIFSDILLIVEPMGLSLNYLKGDGPSIRKTIRSAQDVEAIPEIEPQESLGFVLDAIRLARKTLPKDIPLIGFAGAPFTLASYMIEGGPSKDFEQTKRFMYADQGAWKAFMEKIARATAKYLEAQIQAGVQAVQIFDSWVGCLEPSEYEEYVLPYTAQTIRRLGSKVPAIHFGTGTSGFLELMAKAGGDVIGVDHRIPLDEAWKRIGYDRAIQGNLDPLALCSSKENLPSHVETILKYAAGRPGHIFNLGHGVLPETPLENVIELVDLVHELSKKKPPHAPPSQGGESK